MLKLHKNLFISIIVLLGLSGCVEKRVIVINEPRNTQPRTTHTNNPPIKEEILVGNNRNLGTRIDEVDVPKNHPTLDIKRPTRQESSSGLNGQTIERMPFPADEYRHLPKIGRNTIHGKVYLENSINDEKIIGKNLKLYLNPVTSYSRQWYQDSYLGGYKLSPADKRLFNYLKFTNSDNNGGFSFFGVPKGEYYLIGRITCGKECGYSSPKIIRLVKQVYIDGNTNVNLTKIVP
ncbi:MAG: carboxypeptidase regulatory-like domain-containing protein [Epsilonproteobacteria bacterium]|nr:carboxypeptidase regulatory-like domain-containing protein [Campylobacterota bacterium]